MGAQAEGLTVLRIEIGGNLAFVLLAAIVVYGLIRR